MNTQALNPARLLLLLLLLTACSGRQPVSYSHDIEPMIHEGCLSCHTFEKPGVAEGGFSVDSYATLVQGGNSGLVINLIDPKSSKLPKILGGEIQMYDSDGEHYLITNKHQRELLQEWYDRGLNGG